MAADCTARPGRCEDGNVRWSVVVPVKRVERAKTRLRDAVPGTDHAELVLALAADTVGAVLAAAPVARVVVVTDDARAAAELGLLGAIVVPDLPDAGLNPALRHGARVAARWSADGIAVVGSDRPALRPADLAAALGEAAAHDRTVLPDAAGTGTALLTARPGVALDPRFGPASATAHLRSGAIRLTGDWASLRHDTDTAADLGVARRLGVGHRTAAVLAASPGGAGQQATPGRPPHAATSSHIAGAAYPGRPGHPTPPSPTAGDR
jgi:2-phospho-L-lactate guanylyltransferase